MNALNLLQFSITDIFLIALFFAIGYSIYLLFFRKVLKGRTAYSILFLALYSLLVSIVVIQYEKHEEKERRQDWAEKISEVHDLEAEKKFMKRIEPIKSDSLVRVFINNNQEDSLISYIKNTYFKENLNNYHFFFTFCNTATELYLEKTVSLPCNDFFEHKINELGDSTEFPYLFVFNYGIEYYSYLYKLCLYPDGEYPEYSDDADESDASERPDGKYPEYSDDANASDGEYLGSKYSERPDGKYSGASDSEYLDSKYSEYSDDKYPECPDEEYPKHLYIEWGKQKINSETNELPYPYSYAYYVNNNLWSHRGSFLYKFKSSFSQKQECCFTKANGYSHLILPIRNNETLIVSYPITHWIYWFYDFSFYLCVFFFLALLCEAIRKPSQFKIKSYSQKLQYTIFGLISSAFLILGVVSFFFIKELNYREHTRALREKSLSALSELERFCINLSPSDLFQEEDKTDIGTQRNSLEASKDDRAIKLDIEAQLKEDLRRWARLLLSDIYLYDANGKFWISNTKETPDINEFNTEAIFSELSAQQSHLVILEEKHTKKRHWTAYTPFRNANNQVLGFLVIPSYWNQSEWNNEVNRYLSAYLNLFVILGFITLVISYLLARYVTRSLQILGQNLSDFKLSGNNKALTWKSDDEIGQLVNRYNRMLNQLEESVQKLAESERQSAWKEMARQVAHEIKNPLTPLKLQAQQLERAYNDNKPDFDKRLHNFTELLYKQIELLSRITDTFSHLSQWQQPNIQQVSIKDTIESVCRLFAGHEQIKIETIIVNPDTEHPLLVKADPQFLEQILINLLRNAVQALEESNITTPEIKIKVALQENHLIISVQDNGPGIDNEKISRIFEPHFTTRSGGSGLGLAISNRMAESMKGTLSVTNLQEGGACFTISIPSGSGLLPK